MTALQAAQGGADGQVMGVAIACDALGGLVLPDEGVLVVADLHFEKGSALARRGVLLPPYDTAATLAVLGRLVARHAPRLVVALGDSFHDGGGPDRLCEADRAALSALQRGREWVWVTGNHDPAPAEGVGGRFVETLTLAGLTFRHEPQAGATGEIAGHLHPCAKVRGQGRAVRRRAFATDGKRCILPALGAYTGGLNIRDAAFRPLFSGLAFSAMMLGDARVYPVAASRCLPD